MCIDNARNFIPSVRDHVYAHYVACIFVINGHVAFEYSEVDEVANFCEIISIHKPAKRRALVA